ncbi:hypothetical protein CKO45_17850 [Paracraurococcus ruber]|uniref:Uncharacterized protein n=2 Tax=Paracraurococcus ruber TaxID=77675 RepID=A0ABS1CZX9_9PROT|nr:hypothetical protein [Paracraurococcus ruber]
MVSDAAMTPPWRDRSAVEMKPVAGWRRQTGHWVARTRDQAGASLTLECDLTPVMLAAARVVPRTHGLARGVLGGVVLSGLFFTRKVSRLFGIAPGMGCSG